MAARSGTNATCSATENDDPRPKYYVLEMFPYPSGRIHMGHVRNYAMGDVVARYKRAEGFNVLHPMGWDAFGMPAENAAMQNKVHPEGMDLRQHRHHARASSSPWACRSTGAARSPPATRPITSTSSACSWTSSQAGLVDRKTAKVNWDPVDQTVLANEQVIDGRGWRSGALVEQRELTQWFFKITDFAQDLHDRLDTLERWPEKVRLMQRNWIGRSEGLLVRFALEPDTTPGGESELEIYTTRPDTLFGAKFMALAPDHPLAQAAARNNPELAAFIEECRRIGTAQEAIEKAEKLGFDTGIRADAPVRPDLDAAGLRRELHPDGLRHRRHLRLPGARPARPRLRQPDTASATRPSSARPASDPATFVITDTAYDGDGRMINSRFLDGMTHRGGQGGGGAAPGSRDAPQPAGGASAR